MIKAVPDFKATIMIIVNNLNHHKRLLLYKVFNTDGTQEYNII